MPSLGAPEILVVLLIALLVFGPNRLPEVGRQVGKGIRELRKLQETVRSELDGVLHGDDEPPTAEAAPEAAPPPPSSAVSISPTRPAPRAPSRFRPPTPGPTA